MIKKKPLYIHNFINIKIKYINDNLHKFSEVLEYYNALYVLNNYLFNTSTYYEALFHNTYFDNKGLFDMNKIRMETSKKYDVYQMGLILYNIILYTIVNNSSEVKKIPIRIFKLLRGMLEPNPFERYSITDVIEKYSSIFQLGSVTITKDQNDKGLQKAKIEKMMNNGRLNIQIITSVMDVYNWDNEKILYELAKFNMVLLTKDPNEKYLRKTIIKYYLYIYITNIDKVITIEQHSDTLEQLVINTYKYVLASDYSYNFNDFKNIYLEKILQDILTHLFNIDINPLKDTNVDTLKETFNNKMMELMKDREKLGGNKLKSMIKADIIKILLNKYPNMKNLKSMSKNELMKLLKKKKLSKA